MPAAASAEHPAGSSDGASSIEDILERSAGETSAPGPRVKGYTHREGWSDAPFDLDALGAVDADAKISIGQLTLRTMRLDQSDLTFALKNRVVETTLDEVHLYKGKARGTLTLDSGASPPSLNANIMVDGVSAEDLLKDAAGFGHLAGKGRLTVFLAAKGTSERELVESLDGKVEFSIADGAVIGIDIPTLAHNLGKGNLGKLAIAPTDKTAFSELTSTWTVKQGVAENQDLKVTSDLVGVTGAGRITIPAREIDYTLRPRLASASPDAAAPGASGIEIPVRMYGPWDDPKFSADLGGALKNPDTAKQALKDIKKKLKGKNADEIVEDLLGKGETADSAKAKGKKLLDQFLNKE
jgi:AsmA protein